MTVKVSRREHPVWRDWMNIRENHPELLTLHRNNPIIGQWQYLYESDKGEISLVELPNYFGDGIDWWEIMSIGKTDLFEDCERFRTKEQAEKRIYELLDESKD